MSATVQGAAPLPEGETTKITGNAGFENEGSFSGKLYNGSSWVVTSLVLTIGIDPKSENFNPKDTWVRNHKVELVIEPMKVCYFDISVVGVPKGAKPLWNVSKAFGYLEKTQ